VATSGIRPITPASQQQKAGKVFEIALVGPELEENLSLRYLASSLTAAGFDPEIIPFDSPEHLPAVLAALLESGESPALVGLSLSFQRRAQDFLALSVALRQKGYAGHITAGGHFGTFACREILRDFPEINSICRHEAEETMVSLARALASGSELALIPGLAYRDLQGEIRLTSLPALPDLHKLPPPDRRGEPAECLGHRIAPLVASRGCYANCAFCCISAWHEQTQPGKRFRLRPVEDVADEMAELYYQRKIEIFIFHDDNFFLPNHAQTLKRINALGNQLDQRGVRNVATIVKARPDDLDPVVISAMRDCLGLIRVYIGIETNSDQGLLTLNRHLNSAQNHAALALVEQHGIYPSFNTLIFDPSTRTADLETNLAFMEKFAAVPQNFARVELYAGTPLLARMQAEGRCTGDYLDSDYRIADDDAQKVFELAMECFYVRNFSDASAANLVMGTRFVVEVAARYHPGAFRETWRTEVKQLNRELTLDSVHGIRAIIQFVKARRPTRDETEFTATLAAKLRATERSILEASDRLECEIRNAIRDPAHSHAKSSEPRGNPREKAPNTKSSIFA
jgi:radical SAM superfamily enzyme YgiQ (UPF0313 family)